VTTAAEFRAALLARVLERAAANATGAGDREWSVAGGWATSPRSRARDLAVRLGVHRRRFDPALAAGRLDELLAAADGFARTWDVLADERSRSLLLDLLARRVLGPHHVALPVTPATFQGVWAAMQARVVGTERIDGPAGARLPLVEHRGIRLWADPFQLVAFELGQYAPARPGEVVVDGGAGFGETALAFAQQAGPGGRVVAVELDAANRAVIERNLALNPELAGRIEVRAGALWDAEGVELPYAPMGGLSTVRGSGALATTLTVDGLGLERVDRLKLDVEGAEPAALRGAAATLARDRPQLAVAAYHRADDLAVLPGLIADLAPGSRFQLGHFTPGLEETILTSA
jgi:FkbM family methyltransferase